ncbi:MAG: zinc-binding dehydrogenase [Gemmatimonadetes bacterium]|nr:zinc-binding dehydrogenase [Gemmatimonadota bacterium]
MKAAVFGGPEQGLSIEEVPDPRPGPGEVLIRVAACGVCHTDLHYLDNGTPTFKPPPIILGHEISGTVAELGQGVDTLHPGDRVLVAAVTSCGACSACRNRRENICENGVMLGNHADGGYAELTVAPARDVFPLPDEVPLVEGCIIADALTTPFHAVVHRAQVGASDQVVVIGCGGVGLNVIQMVIAQGGRVVAVDLSEEKLEWARRFGAAETVNPLEVERVDKAVRRLTGGGADVAFEVVGKADTQETALSCLRTGGRLILVGYSPETMSLNAGRVMFRELSVLGSLGCPPIDYPRVIELVRQGRLKVKELVTHHFALDDIEQALDTLRNGEAIRAVVTP